MNYNEIVNDIIEENSCEIDSFGNKMWTNSSGFSHRENDKPATIWSDGTKAWYQNNEYHRDNDKPAIIYADGTKIWYINGKVVKTDGQY